MKLGPYGERLAQRYYEQKGYRLVQANYRVRGGEIDLILQKETLLVFAEVKTRSFTTNIRPSEAVDLRKQTKIQNTALAFIQEHQLSDPNMRFDVVEVWVDTQGESRLHCIENAF